MLSLQHTAGEIRTLVDMLSEIAQRIEVAGASFDKIMAGIVELTGGQQEPQHPMVAISASTPPPAPKQKRVYRSHNGTRKLSDLNTGERASILSEVHEHPKEYWNTARRAALFQRHNLTGLGCQVLFLTPDQLQAWKGRAKQSALIARSARANGSAAAIQRTN